MGVTDENPNRYGGNACAEAMAKMMDGTCVVEPCASEDGQEHAIKPMGYRWWSDALKYVWRWPHKGGARDIDKAIDCLQRLKASVFEIETR